MNIHQTTLALRPFFGPQDNSCYFGQLLDNLQATLISIYAQLNGFKKKAGLSKGERKHLV